ncbi:MAG: ParB/RepB/Spo0J family partition protein [Bacteroidales bacterium]|nr:ParB/RepB/Spo0J family partition protein [Bacteroidales bacterium]MBN2757079.1 ParB/RepB/Spo0J family partition protein [Bacteroidales bacterium]
MSAVKKQALGRGLGALIDDAKYEKRPVKEAISTSAIAEIDISKIETNPFQPRKEFDEELLQELSNSIKELGIIQPITVKKIDEDKFQIISGERRFRASKLAGLKEIIAFVREADDQGLLEMALVENIQREDLNSIEVAVTYERLIDECSLTQEKLSERIGKKRTTITNYLRLLKLPAEVQVGVRDKRISMGHAKALLTLNDSDSQMKIFHKIIVEGLSVRNVEALVREKNYPVKKDEKKSEKASLPKEYLSFKNNLNQVLSTKVDLKKSENGKGSIVISFNSEEDFNRISQILVKK